MKVSVVIPVYNEEDNVQPLAEELTALTERLDFAEILFVDDGSSDATWARIEESIKNSPVVRGLKMPRNGGQSSAMLAGLAEVTGDIVVTIDGDMQNNPADIPKLVEEIDGADAVCGYRANRKDTWQKRIGSRIGNRVRNWFTHDGIRDTGCSLKAFRRHCIGDLPPVDGVHRFMPAYFKLNGRAIKQIPVDHRPRRFGESKYTNLKRLPRTLYDLFGFCWYRSRYIRK